MVRVWIRVPTVVWRIIRVSVPVAVVGTLKRLADQSDLAGRVEQYRYLEATVRARAWNETSPAVRRGWMNLAEAYGRLAEQAERTSGADLAHPLHGLWIKAAAGICGSRSSSLKPPRIT